MKRAKEGKTGQPEGRRGNENSCKRDELESKEEMCGERTENMRYRNK